MVVKTDSGGRAVFTERGFFSLLAGSERGKAEQAG
jgi:hypothetical protein